MNQPQKTILQALLDFANTGNMSIPTGVVFQGEGEPVALFNVPYTSELVWEEIHKECVRILTEICQSGPDVGIAHINEMQLKSVLWSEGDAKPYTTIPIIERPTKFPAMALYLGFTAPTGTGDSWGHRIQKCKKCAMFFLRKTKKPSNFCKKNCRYGWFNALKATQKKTPA